MCILKNIFILKRCTDSVVVFYWWVEIFASKVLNNMHHTCMLFLFLDVIHQSCFASWSRCFSTLGNVTLRCAGPAMLTEMIKHQETASSFFFIHVINLARIKPFMITQLMQCYMRNLNEEIVKLNKICPGWAWRRKIGDETDGNTNNRLTATIL